MDDIYIYNPIEKEAHTKAFGNHFSFRPGQIKRMRKEMGEFIAEQKAYMGLVSVPYELSDEHRVAVPTETGEKVVLYRDTEQGQADLKSHAERGISKRIEHLTAQVQNLQVSLAQDLAAREMKIDPNLLATEGDIAAMEELASYQKRAEDANKAKLEHVRKLQRQIAANSNGMVNKK